MATGLFNLKQVNQAISQGAWSGYIAPKWVEYLVVAGGGGGAFAPYNEGGMGGGGAGGLLTGIVTVAAGTSYTVTVGSGGAGSTTYGDGNNGVASVFGAISTTGGGGGAGTYGAGGGSGAAGGSGGGNNYGYTNPKGGASVANQGNYGGAGARSYSSNNGGGGGGGAGTSGLNGTTIGGNGGAGIASAISGTVTTYAGGGGGGGSASGGGFGGVGGGGGGTSSTNNAAGAGTANTGGGGGGNGGGGSSPGGAGGSGGSGIVVVRYPGNVQFFTGGTVNYNNGYIIHIFTASGTLAPTTPTVYNTSYQISRSLRFNSADSAYLSRTYSNSATDLKKQTFSFWYKRTEFATDGLMFGGYDGTSGASNYIGFLSSSGTTVLRLSFAGGDIFTTQVFRDPSAWYHIVVALDTTQATDTNRLKLYVNGSQVTSFTVNAWPTLNSSSQFALTNNRNAVGSGYSGNGPMNGYMTEVNFIDGQALTPSSFGATSTTNGVWAPIQYTGTYGTNGFYLNFSDNSNTTAATLGKDYSGNGNNWTPNNFSVTAGAGNDSLVDSPTSYGTDTGVGGEVRGNYATLNPLILGTTTTLANGNLDYSKTNTLAPAASFSTIGITSGKWYAEYTVASNFFFGIWGNGSSSLLATAYPTYYWDVGASSGALAIEKSSGTSSGSGGTFAAGDIYGVAFDADAATCNFYKNNTLIFSVTGMVFSGPLFFTVGAWGGGAASGPNSMNFGQRPFAYTAPSGYKALCTQNLPTPTIGATSTTNANLFFNPVLYTGDRTDRTITVGFQPDLVWVKPRNNADGHYWMNAVVGTGKYLMSDSTASEVTNANTLTAYTSTGFSVGNTGTTNETGRTYVAWNWKANGSGSTNTAGSITSTVSANTTSGFSVVTYTGTGSTATVGHGLGVAPSMIIVKARNSSSQNWVIYHASLGINYTLIFTTSAAISFANYWGAANPTTSVFGVANGAYDNNTSGTTYVGYCFAEVAGYSKFGSYTGNGSADGPFVYTGFRPAYVMAKKSSGIEIWYVLDSKRGTYNVNKPRLNPNNSDAESTAYDIMDFTSNGFKLRNSDTSWNANGDTYIFAAFAESPFKYSLAR